MSPDVGLVDIWSLGHAALGIALGLAGRKLWPIAWLLTLWELFENSDSVPLPWGDPSFFNSLVDIVIGVLAAGVTLILKVRLKEVVPSKYWDAVDD